MRHRQLIRLAVWFALITALLELLVRLGLRVSLGQVMALSRDAGWMAPLGQLAIFGIAALVMYAIAAARHRRPGIGAAVGVFTFFAIAGVLLASSLIHPAGVALLAAGAGVQAGLLARRNGAAVAKLVRLTTPVLLVVFIAGAGGIAVTRAVAERQAIAALPDAPANAPNVILIVWDAVRAPSVGLYGATRPTTPNLDRLAQDGVVFDRAIATAPWTLPSHASMFTGKLRHELKVGWTVPLGDTPRTLAEVFRDAGYRTGGFAANVLYTDWEHGLSRGFTHYEDYPIEPGQVVLSTALGRWIIKGRHGWEHGKIPRVFGYRQFMGRRLGESVDREFLDWLDDRDGRPVFAFLNYFDAHLPFEPPAPFDTLFGPARSRTNIVERARDVFTSASFWDGISDEEVAAELAAYEGSIAYLDHRLGLLMAELDRRGMRDNTLVIITSDHGEEFLEHGDHEHGSNLYLTQLAVPLVVLYPGHVPAGVRVAEPVSTRDVAATIAKLTRVPGGGVFEGSSLALHWSPSITDRAMVSHESVLSELVPGLAPDRRMRSIIAGRYHYIRNPDGRYEMYDFIADPLEKRDLAPSIAIDDLPSGISN